MTVGPRTKLVLLASIFALPIVASFLAYRYADVRPTANHGELLLPPAQASDAPFRKPGGGAFSFHDLAGRWVLVAQDGAACSEACLDKLVAMRQVRLALGRDAERVTRVLLVDDGRVPDPLAFAAFPGMEIALGASGAALDRATAGDHQHVYLVDPHGNVVMRWRAAQDPKGMLKDLQRLLRASQIG